MGDQITVSTDNNMLKGKVTHCQRGGVGGAGGGVSRPQPPPPAMPGECHPRAWGLRPLFGASWAPRGVPAAFLSRRTRLHLLGSRHRAGSASAAHGRHGRGAPAEQAAREDRARWGLLWPPPSPRRAGHTWIPPREGATPRCSVRLGPCHLLVPLPPLVHGQLSPAAFLERGRPPLTEGVTQHQKARDCSEVMGFCFLRFFFSSTCD